MDVLGGMSLLSGGMRMARSMAPSKAEPSGKPFTIAPNGSLGAQVVERRDKDGDGSLTMDELGASRKIFERLDTDGDGLLTATELDEGIVAAGQARRTESAISRYIELHDSDADRLISPTESGVDSEVFSVIDRNSDQYLNRGELTSAYRQQTMDISG